MAKLLEALKGARKIAERRYADGVVTHWLLPNGQVMETLRQK